MPPSVVREKSKHGTRMKGEEENRRQSEQGRKWVCLYEKGMDSRIPGESRKFNLIHVWVPLAFPDIPKKGEFDVRTLKESKYFFS